MADKKNKTSAADAKGVVPDNKTETARQGGEQSVEKPAAQGGATEGAEGSNFDVNEKVIITALGGAAVGALIGFYGSKYLNGGKVSWPSVTVAAFGLAIAAYLAVQTNK